MRAYDNITIYTADDEDPLCGRCDNVCDGNDELCVESAARNMVGMDIAEQKKER